MKFYFTSLLLGLCTAEKTKGNDNSWPKAAGNDLAGGNGVFYNIQCMENKCSKSLEACFDEGNSLVDTENYYKSFDQRSQCGTVLLCLWEREMDEEASERSLAKEELSLSDRAKSLIKKSRAARRERGADSCQDGTNKNMMSLTERDLKQCAHQNQCTHTQSIGNKGEAISEMKLARLLEKGENPSIVDANAKPAFVINNVNPSCLRDNCKDHLDACDNNAECKAIFECLEVDSLHKENNEVMNCAKHLFQVSQTEKNVLACGRDNQCINENSDKGSSFLEENAGPTSMFQLSSSSHLRNRSSKNILADLQKNIAGLKRDLESADSIGKADVSLLDDSARKSKHQIDDAIKKIRDIADSHDPIAPQSMIQKDDNEAFLLPLRNIAKQAHQFIEKSKIEQKKINEEMKNQNDDEGEEEDNSFMQVKDSGMNKLTDAKRALENVEKELAVNKEKVAERHAERMKERDSFYADMSNRKLAKKMRDDTFSNENTHTDNEDSNTVFLQSSVGHPKVVNHEQVKEWRDEFEDELNRARQQLNLSKPDSLPSLLQEQFTDNKLEEDKRSLASIERSFHKDLAALKEGSKQLMEEGKQDFAKEKELEEKYINPETNQYSSESLMQERGLHRLDVQKLKEGISSMEKALNKEAKALSHVSTSESDPSVENNFDNLKQKEETELAEINELGEKSKQDYSSFVKDIDNLKKSVNKNRDNKSFSGDDYGSSFLQKSSNELGSIELLDRLSQQLHEQMKQERMGEKKLKSNLSFAEVKNHVPSKEEKLVNDSIYKATKELANLKSLIQDHS